MDKLWIDKLCEIRARLKKHRAEKEIFEAKPYRGSLNDLREGQRLKREGELIASHLAQLAEFATGIPAEKFNFRLDLRPPYQYTTSGELQFGPSALLEVFPFINFDIIRLFGRAKEKEIEPLEQEPGDNLDKIEKFSDRIAKKYEEPVFSIIDERKFTAIKPVRLRRKLEGFIGKISKLDKYFESILGKYTPGPLEISKFPCYYIYQGEFVYLSRRGKWAKIHTSVLSQIDYFAEAGTSMPILARKRFALKPEGKLEISEAADLITDDLAEPVAAPNADLGLGYFIPLRRLGRTSPPISDFKRPKGIVKAGTKPGGISLIGSKEFASEVMLKAESSEYPIEQLSPAYISVTGRKIDKAKSFAMILKSRLQKPRSEPARRAVEALLPALEEIVREAGEREKPEERLSELERSFDDLVQAHLRPFKLAAEPSGVSKAWMGSGETRVERVLRSSFKDTQIIIGKYLPDITRPQEPLMQLISPAPRPSEVFGRMDKLAPEMAPAFMAEPGLIRPYEASVRRLPDRIPPTAIKGLPGMLGGLAFGFGTRKSAPDEVMKKPQELGLGFVQAIIGKFARGLPGDISAKFGGLLRPEAVTKGITGIFGGLSKLKIGDLLKSKDGAKAPGILPPADIKPELSKSESLMQKGPGAVAKILRLVESESLPRGAMGRVSGLLPGAPSMLKGLPRGLFGLADMIPGRISDAASGLRQIRPSPVMKFAGVFPGLRELAPRGIKSAISSLLPSVPSKIGEIVGGLPGALAGKTDEVLGGITRKSGLPGYDFVQEKAEAMISGILGKARIPPIGGLADKASGLFGGLKRAVGGGIGSMASQEVSALGGLLKKPRPSTESRMDIIPGSIDKIMPQVSNVLPKDFGAIGGLAGRTEGLSKAISGLAGGLPGGIGDLVPPTAKIGAAGAILPTFGGLKDMAGGVAEAGKSGLPFLDSLAGVLPAISGKALPHKIAKIPILEDLPKGWDRPPFEVGSAIRRHLIKSRPEQPGEPAAKVPARLADYGLSIIDLEETEDRIKDLGVSQIKSAGEIEIDDDTIDSIYFRLKRILETEKERMGGES